MTTTALVAVSLALLAAIVAVRLAFVRQAAASRVDHHFWLQAAVVIRADSRLPPRLPGKFLLEDATLSYPPFFGWLLARFSDDVLRRHAVLVAQAADLGLAALVAWVVASGPGGFAGALVAVAIVGFAPVLVAYNVQVNPRGWGNLFLTAKLVLEAAGAGLLPFGLPIEVAWLAAAAATALVFLSHKMTIQLMLFLWPVWALALGSPVAAAMPPVGLVLAILVTGPSFAAYQWRGHADIVRFWHRRWRWLGAHPLRHSPVYGDPALLAESAFHKPGLAGVRAHLRTVAGYGPALLVLPLALPLVPPPPVWILVWFAGAYAAVFLTLFVPALKCFGGGHYYVFNAVAPGALWWGHLAATPEVPVIGLGALAAILTAAALTAGWRQRAGQKVATDADFEQLVADLRAAPPGRIAVFPLVRAEDIAARTPHAVLWGGHGYGFERLDLIYPVVSQPLVKTFAQYRIGMVAWHVGYWPDGETALRAEGLVNRIAQYGQWRLADVPTGS